MKANKTLVLGTVLTAAGVGAAMSQDAKADSIYTVQSGDTLYKISQKFNVSMEDIAEANNLEDINTIYVNEQLTIPTDGDVQQPQKATSTQSNYSAAANQNQTAVKTTAKAANTQTTSTKTYTSNNTQSTQSYSAPKAQKSSSYTSQVSGSEAAAKAWIANKESTNNYNARNGQYIGKYQLSASYLNGDYSAANQERVADKYVHERYGSWSAAQAFHQANGWY